MLKLSILESRGNNVWTKNEYLSSKVERTNNIDEGKTDLSNP
ncbi:MAG: hypothetical protein CM15mP102_02520 [Flavobacteriales bacterium]|nr:MAG: hypothetical protein CM15mP102_02520 [Flavobacteriales bacterium]